MYFSVGSHSGRGPYVGTLYFVSASGLPSKQSGQGSATKLRMGPVFKLVSLFIMHDYRTPNEYLPFVTSHGGGDLE